MDSVKQSAALCLLRLNRTSPDLVPMGEWTARVVHLLNDQHLVSLFFLLKEECVVSLVQVVKVQFHTSHCFFLEHVNKPRENRSDKDFIKSVSLVSAKTENAVHQLKALGPHL